MHDICYNRIQLPFVDVKLNNMVHSHYTRSNSNLHINELSTVDKRNFVYYSMLNWNACPLNIRNLPKCQFTRYCKSCNCSFLN